LILKDKEIRDQYKSKYRNWLSKRDDGLWFDTLEGATTANKIYVPLRGQCKFVV
jgi:hypothetical protein